MDFILNDSVIIKNNLFKIYRLNKDCYKKKYIELLPQLTKYHIIENSQNDFDNFLNIIDDNHIIIVIEHNNKIIASTTLLIEPKAIRNYSYVAHIEDVVVDEEYRKFGLGKILLNKCIEIAKLRNCYKCILDCDENLEDFYSKHNFTKKGLYMSLYFSKL